MAAPASDKAASAPNVLFCTLSIFNEIGGIQQFNQRIIDAARASFGHEIGNLVVLSLADSSLMPGQPETVMIGCGGHRARYVVEFINCLIKYHPALILFGHINLALLGIVARIVAPRAACTLFVHGIEVWNDRRYRSRRWYEPWLIRHFIACVISVSGFTAEVMKWQFHLRRTRFEILPNAVDLDDGAASARVPPRAAEHPPTLISVTRLADRYKGIEKVINAVVRLRPRLPTIKYHIVGDGPMKAELMAQARALGLADAVHFHGEVTAEGLAALYRSADIFVLPSQKEGFGIVFLEAWKYGLPVICGGVDASPEVVLDGNSGIVIDPNDVTGLADAIERLVREPARRARLADNGLARLRRNYTHPIFVRTFRAILAKLLAGNRSAPAE